MATEPGVVVVTGAGTGIGRRSCEVLADAGHPVAALGRRTEKLRGYETSGEIRGFRCDVREPTQVAACLEEIRSSLGTVCGLVNAAGTIIEQSIEELTLDVLRAQFRTNVEGTIIMIQQCLDDLKQTRGAVVNFSSMLTQRPLPKAVGYTATKGAIEGLTKALAAELAPHGVRVNVIRPSLVRSDIYIDTGMDPEVYDRMLDELTCIFPLGRVGEPDDVAGMVLLLMSASSTWITGSEFNVDGGRAIG